MSNPTTKRIIEAVAQAIDIPDTAYAKATKRYEDLAKWFTRSESRCGKFNPSIYAQGSFRLGTVIKPVDPNEDFDLDMGCRLRTGMTKASHTQNDLKHLVGNDLEDYRVCRQIQEEREEKHRCWRLKYSDEMNFHLDAVPSIPETSARRLVIQEAMTRAGTIESLAKSVANLSGAITDNTMKNYEVISDDWRISNSEGYALWFESRMEQARVLVERWAKEAQAAKIDKLPPHQRKSPLQRCVQLLKRHRDMVFKNNPDGKPISVILTTLAAAAYQGEVELHDALDTILSNMGQLVNPTKPRVPNPVNPLEEDFADKWYDPKYAHLHLEQNFKNWLATAQADFHAISSARDAQRIADLAKTKLGVGFNVKNLSESLGLGTATVSVAPKTQIITESPAKPWLPS